jgi:hypothetical protein
MIDGTEGSHRPLYLPVAEVVAHLKPLINGLNCKVSVDNMFGSEAAL